MEFKVGDLVSAEKWTPHGNVDGLGMIVECKTSRWRIEWYSFDVEKTWYSRHDMLAFRNNYLALRHKLNL